MHPSISVQAFQERRTQQLRVDHVTKQYVHGTRALDDVSLTLMSGLTCVIGPPGAGKSTLLNVLGARERPDQGTVCLGEIDAVDSPALLRTLVAHVPTDTRVPPPVPVHVALEHFAAFRDPSDPQLRLARVEAQLRRVDLWGARTLRVGELTPAMHWRMMLAIALLGVLLSDVFTASINVNSEHAREVLGQIMAGGWFDPAGIDAFHQAFRVVMFACAACAFLAGLIGLLTAPGKPQKTE